MYTIGKNIKPFQVSKISSVQSLSCVLLLQPHESQHARPHHQLPEFTQTQSIKSVMLTVDWLDLLAVQGTLKSLLQHHNSKASILQCSAFFTVQLSHPYMTTRKTIALTRRTFVGKVTVSAFQYAV